MEYFDRYLGERVKNSNYVFSNGLGIKLKSEKFDGCSLKRTFLKDSKIKKSSFFQCAFTGSRFENTIFKKCKIKYVNFQFSTFMNCYFSVIKGKNLRGNNFDHCYFYKAVFSNVNFDGCSISCSHFIECVFDECIFNASTFECTLFQKCKFSNVNMAELNIEYSQFSHCILKNVVFPYTQLPYIIGFSDFQNNEDIRIATDNEILSFMDYQQGFEKLIDYYKYVKEQFPIANLYLFLGKADEAFSILKDELLQSLLKSDYRLIKHICRLATFNDTITPSKVKELFDLVKENLNKIESETQTLECLNNIDEIRRLILEAKYDKKMLKVIIETNIPSNDLDEIQSVIRKIEETISKTLPNSDCYSKSIEIRHNSPYELLVQLCNSLPEIEKLVSEFINVLPTIAEGLTIVCSSLELKDRIKKKRKQNPASTSHITKITIIIE